MVTSGSRLKDSFPLQTEKRQQNSEKFMVYYKITVL